MHRELSSRMNETVEEENDGGLTVEDEADSSSESSELVDERTHQDLNSKMPRESRSRKSSSILTQYELSDQVFKKISNYKVTKRFKNALKRAKESSKVTLVKNSNYPPVKRNKYREGREKQITNSQEAAILTDRKRREELEFIQRCRIARRPSSTNVKPLPVGQDSVADLNAAIAKSFRESNSLLLNWTAGYSKRIGSYCKVFWDGDNAWYYARILNYDSVHDMNFIYYESDNTVEWINLNKETVLVTEDIQLAKYGSCFYPCITYWVSSKAREALKTLRGYKSGGTFIEYFNETGIGEYAFVNAKSLSPLSFDSYTKGKNSRKFDGIMESARAEQGAIDNIVELVLASVKSKAFEQLGCDEWIGVRVRAATSLIKSQVHHDKIEEVLPRSQKRKDNPIAMCVGTISKYCRATDKYLIIFDEDKLQPQWVTCSPTSYELLLTPAESVGYSPSESFLRSNGPKSFGDCAMCGLGRSDSEKCPWQFEHVVDCSNCSSTYHTYCHPEGDRELFSKSWRCWQCNYCYNCGSSGWECELLDWNLNRISSVDKPMRICGTCLEAYIVTNNYCPLCWKIFNSSDSTTRQDLHSNLDTGIHNDSDMMVQCNECNLWVHAFCDGIDKEQYDAISRGTHPVWGDEYLCPNCRVTICLRTLDQMLDMDTLKTFAEPVTEALAANYFEIIRSPMDLLTMREKARCGQYKSLQSLRQDFELMCLNALVYNKIGDEYWVDAVQYYNRVARDIFSNNGRSTIVTAYGSEINSILSTQSAIEALKAKATSNKSVLERSKRRLSASYGTGLSDYVDDSGRPIQVTSKRRLRVDVAEASDIQPETTNINSADRRTSEDVEKSDSAPREASEIGGADSNIQFSGTDSSSQVDVSMKNYTETESLPSPNTIETLPISPSNVQEIDLPKYLAKPPTPNSYIDCPATILSLEKAFMESFMDSCLLCTSCDSTAYMLHCFDCGESFHSFCVGAPLASMSKSKRLLWRCPNCKICEICGDASDDDANSLIYCDNCDQTFHIGCLEPTVTDVQQSSQWFCNSCVSCKRTNVSGRKHVWGNQLNYCISCRKLDEMSINASRLANQSAQGNDIRFCQTCKHSVKDVFLRCSKCRKFSHPVCNDMATQSYMWIRDCSRCWTCQSCLNSISVANADSHLGTLNDEKISLLSKLSLIQRKRMHSFRSLRMNANVAFEKLMQSKWSNDRKLLCAVYRWGIGRLSTLLSLSLNKLNSSSKFDQTTFTPPYWSRQRAHRFVAMFRLLIARSARKKAFLSDSNGIFQYSLEFLSSFAGGLSRSLKLQSNQTSLNVIGIKACLASAFIRHTDRFARKLKFETSEFDDQLEVAAKATLGILHDRQLTANESQGLLSTMDSIDKLHKALLLQPIGLRDTLLSDDYVNGSYSNVSSHTSQEAPKSFDRCLPHWAPGGRMKSSQPASGQSDFGCGRPSLIRSVKRVDSSQFTSFTSALPYGPSSTSSFNALDKQLNISSSNASTYRLSTKKDISMPQSIPAVSRLVSVNVGCNGDGFYSSRLRLQLATDGTNPYVKNYTNVMVGLHENMPQELANLIRIIRQRQRDFSHYSTSHEIMTEKSVSNAGSQILCKPVVCGSSFTHDSVAREVEDSGDNTNQAGVEGDKVTSQVKGDYSMKILAIDGSEARKMILKKRKLDDCDSSKLPAFEWGHNASGGNVHFGWLGSLTKLQNVKQEVPVSVDMDNIDDDPVSMDASTASLHQQPLENAFNLSSMKWFNYRLCCLCKLPFNLSAGRILMFSDGIGAHVNCLRWSSDVYEKSNTIVNALKARDRGMRTKCWLCEERGASICCKHCRRVYHFKCAKASNCTFLETRHVDEAETSQHAIYPIMLCPEHVSEIDYQNTNRRANISSRTEPLDPIRPLFLDSYLTTTSKEIAELLSEKRSDITVRTGSMVLHSMGSVNIHLQGFFSRDYIYPHKFVASRIFWSMHKPWRRSVYVLEILRRSDLVSEDLDSQNFAIKLWDEVIAESRRIYSLSPDDRSMLSGLGLKPGYDTPYDDVVEQSLDETPIFRVKAFDLSSGEGDRPEVEQPNSDNGNDSSSPPIYSRSLEEAYCVIISRVMAWKKIVCIGFKQRKQMKCSYGLDPHQFFGIGLPFVRHSIERLPESVASMFIVEGGVRDIRYRPSYHLPSSEAISRIKAYLQSQKSWKERRSVNGSFRADRIMRHTFTFKKRKSVRSLAKAVGEDEDPKLTGDEPKGDIEDDSDRLENQRVLSSKYVLMSSTHLRDPDANLIVRKSSIHGYGLFAKICFNKNDMIVEYIGEKIRQSIADRREVLYEEEGVGSCYLFRQDKDAIIDATRTGGMARFINHCCEPNAYARIIATIEKSDDEDVEAKHIVIIAARDINAGEEITYDYKFPLEDNKLRCFCNATKCLGFMN